MGYVFVTSGSYSQGVRQWNNYLNRLEALKVPSHTPTTFKTKTKPKLWTEERVWRAALTWSQRNTRFVWSGKRGGWVRAVVAMKERKERSTECQPYQTRPNQSSNNWSVTLLLEAAGGSSSCNYITLYPGVSLTFRPSPPVPNFSTHDCSAHCWVLGPWERTYEKM